MHGHFPPREFAQKLAELGKEYNTALLAVERNNHGHGVLACLQTLEYPRVFKQKGQDGWLTSAVSRPVMIENLASALMEEPRLFQEPTAAEGVPDVCQVRGRHYGSRPGNA